MSHIEVPPFQRPRSDYQLFLPAQSSIVSRPRLLSGPPPTLQEVLQASLRHNANVGALPYDSSEKGKRKLKRDKDREENSVDGPSSVPYPTGHIFHFGPANIARTKKRLKRSSADDDNWGAPPRAKKRPRPLLESRVVDLTITDDDEPVRGPKAKPTPKPKPPNPISKPLPKPRPTKKFKFIHAAYNPETDIVVLCLEDIRPVPLEVLTLNTRYLRQLLGNDVITTKEASAPGPKGNTSANFTNINHTRQNGSRPCFLSIAANSSSSSSTKDTVEAMSVGGVIWELPEEIRKEVIEISSESDTFSKNVPQRHSNVPSFLTSQIPPINPKRQHQKKARESHQNRQQLAQRRQSTGDDVNKLSSTLNAPLDSIVHLPPPRAMSSNAKGNLATQQPKKVRESQHSQQRKKKQTIGDDGNGSFTIFDTPHEQVVIPLLPPPRSTSQVNVTPQHQKKPRESQYVRQHSSGDKGTRSSSGPLLRPPHSARSSLDGQILDSGSDHLNAAMPSAKALGKRRAVSPTSISTTTTPQQHPVPSYSAAPIHDIQLSSHHSSTSTPAHDPYVVQNSDFNVFIDYPSAISPAAQANTLDSTLLSNSFNPLDTLPSFYDLSSSSSQNHFESHIGSDDVDASHHRLASSNTDTPPHPPVYNSQPQPASRGHSFFSSAGSLFNDMELPGDQHDHQYDHEPQQQYGNALDGPWSSSLHSENQYAYETIDPTLLGGGEVVEPSLEMEMDMIDTELDVLGVEFEKEFDDQVQQKDSTQLGFGFELSKESTPSSASSTDSSSSSSGSAQAKKTDPSLRSVSASDNYVPADDDEEERGKEENYERKLPPRKRTKRVMPDMISHDDLDLLASTIKKPKRRYSSSSASSALDADRSGSDSETDYESDDDGNKLTVRRPIIPKSTISSISPTEPTLKVTTTSQADKNQHFLKDKVDAYCHQCRRKTFYAKMSCSGCQKKFCVRCYAFRFVCFLCRLPSRKLRTCFFFFFLVVVCSFQVSWMRI